MGVTDKLNLKKKVVDNSPMLYGKSAPQAVDVESMVLGAMLVDTKCIDFVLSKIKNEEVFYVDANQRIFSAMKNMMDEGTLIDFITLSRYLRKSEELEMVGGTYYIAKLSQDVVSSAHIDEHIKILLEQFYKRELIRIAGNIISESYEDSSDVFDTLEEFRTNIQTINRSIDSVSYREFSKIVHQFTDKIYAQIKREDSDEIKIKTFIDEFDNVLGELQGGCVYVIAARTSMGKTAFEVSTSIEQSKHFDVGIWNGELTEDRFIFRYLSNIVNVPAKELRDNAKLYEETIMRGLEELMQHKLHMDNTPNITIDALVNKIKFWVFNKGCKCIYLDYLSVIRLTDKKMSLYRVREQQIAYIIDEINSVSKFCNVPIILLAQVNREALKLGDKRPTLGNLRDSGSIEERVYHVSFLHRPEVYGEQEYEGISTKNLLQVLVRKNGDGINNVDIDLRHNLAHNQVKSLKEELTGFKQINEATPF